MGGRLLDDVKEITKGEISEELAEEEEEEAVLEFLPLFLPELLLFVTLDAVAVRTSALLSTPETATGASATAGSSPAAAPLGTVGVELDALTTACSHLTAEVFREVEAEEVEAAADAAAAAAAAALLDARV